DVSGVHLLCLISITHIACMKLHPVFCSNHILLSFATPFICLKSIGRLCS
ncbi:hypothetical protein B0H34DRAFT_726003, partial [Crassisporium funariophilum]